MTNSNLSWCIRQAERTAKAYGLVWQYNIVKSAGKFYVLLWFENMFDVFGDFDSLEDAKSLVEHMKTGFALNGIIYRTSKTSRDDDSDKYAGYSAPMFT